ncbi:MAG: hypothetical protein L6V85_06165 [Clostridiales bacterium]|nr:MAG: hypothetical protein L6V85_06165 [Clostridiales bacterium]
MIITKKPESETFSRDSATEKYPFFNADDETSEEISKIVKSDKFFFSTKKSGCVARISTATKSCSRTKKNTYRKLRGTVGVRRGEP